MRRGHGSVGASRVEQSASQRLGSNTLVVMMQSAEVGKLDDTAAVHRLDLAGFWAVHLQGLMNPPAMIVVEEARENTPLVPLIHHDHMIETLAADAPKGVCATRFVVRRRRVLRRRLSRSVVSRSIIDPLAFEASGGPNPPTYGWTSRVSGSRRGRIVTRPKSEKRSG